MVVAKFVLAAGVGMAVIPGFDKINGYGPLSSGLASEVGSPANSGQPLSSDVTCGHRGVRLEKFGKAEFDSVTQQVSISGKPSQSFDKPGSFVMHGCILAY